jgi:hypothetical protein
MTHLVHLTAADARRVPWRNGRGVTDELLVRPDGASFERGDFDVRISKATVPESGPFSTFEGFDRVLVVTQGVGLRLAHGDAPPGAMIRPLEPYRFSGDGPTAATLLDGPVSDFNVLLRRGRRQADVHVARFGPGGVRERLVAGEAFLHLVTGRLDAGLGSEGPRTHLVPGESLFVCEAREGDELVLVGDGAVAIVVRLTR